MAVFLTNKCKWNGCGITFPNLGDLIQHIEDTHIDYDPKVVEQKEQAQPACLPLSYVLRFISEDARKENPFIASPTNGSELKRKLAIKHHSYSMSSSNRSNTPTGSEMDEDEMVVTESEDSNDSWTTEEFSSEFIMRYGSRHSGIGSNGTPGHEKPFACPVPGCKKRYKNVNGIKYHSKNGHKKDGKVRKGYKCHCGKSYKTAQGLKNHALASHNTTTESTLTTQHIVGNSGSILMPRSTSPSQSLGSLSPSSISNMSSSASSCHGGNGGSNSNAAILQHLTNGVSATITTSNVNGGNHNNSTPGINNNNSNNIISTTSSSNPMNLQIQQQQQQQFNANTTAQQQMMQQQQQQPQPTTATMQISEIFSTLNAAAPIQPQQQQNQFNIANLLTSKRSSASVVVPSSVSLISSPSVVALSAASINQQQQPQPQTMKMSTTTFIEHKYSAKKCKEKFYANLRNDTNNNNKHSNDNNNKQIKSGSSNISSKNKSNNKHHNHNKQKQKALSSSSSSLLSSSSTTTTIATLKNSKMEHFEFATNNNNYANNNDNNVVIANANANNNTGIIPTTSPALLSNAISISNAAVVTHAGGSVVVNDSGNVDALKNVHHHSSIYELNENFKNIFT